MRLGGHVSATGGIHTAIDRGTEIGCEAIQVFSQSPRMWRPTNHSRESLERFRERRAETGLEVTIHAPYLINLASEDEAIVEKSVAALAESVRVAGEIDAIGSIVHVGSHLGAGFEAALELVVARLGPVLEAIPDDTWLLLENTAGAGGTIGRDLDELALLVERSDHPRVGLCLDSCHLFASGWDVRDPAEMDRLVEEVDRKIGLDRLRALHVNDSETPLGANRDRHAKVGAGQIGEGLSAFLGQPRLQGLPALLETGVDSEHLADMRRLWEAGVAARARPARRGR